MSKNFAVSVSIKAVDEATRVLNRVTGNISRQRAQVDAFSEKTQQIGLDSTTKTLTGTWSQFKSEWNGVSNSLETKSFFKRMREGADHAASGFKLLGSAVKDSIQGISTAGFALGGIGFLSSRMFGNLSQSHTELKNSAQGMGVSAKTLHSYRMAAESQGLSGSSIDTAFQRLNQMGFEFRAGNRAASAPLAALPGGVSLLKGLKQRNPEELLKEVLEKLKTSGLSTITKSQLLTHIFGTSDLLPLTQMGGQGLSEKAKVYQNGDDYEQSEAVSQRYMQANTQFKSSLERLGRLASIEILPGVAKGLDRISDWIKSHGDQLKGLFKDIGTSIPREMGRAVAFMGGFATVLSTISNTIGIANLIFTTLSLTIGGKLLGAFYRIGKALQLFGVFSQIGKVFGFLRIALAAPFVIGFMGPLLLATAVVGGSVFVIKKYKNEIIGLVSHIGDLFKTTLTGFTDWTTRMMKPITETLENIFGRKLEIQSSQSIDFLKTQSNQNNFLDQIFKSNETRSTPKESQPSEVRVRFDNLPKGARIEEKKGDVPINISAGYLLSGGFA